MTVPVPRFSIAVNLSERARQRLQKIHESVLAIAYFDGDPLPGQGRYNAPFRDVFLGMTRNWWTTRTWQRSTVQDLEDQLGPTGEQGLFRHDQCCIRKESIEEQPTLVRSPEERLSTFEGKTTDVSCRLIEEQIDEHNPASPALKSLGSSPR